MPELPDRPRLDQLRRQARELQRAAAAGDDAAQRRIHSVAARRVTLASAQLAVARHADVPGGEHTAARCRVLQPQPEVDPVLGRRLDQAKVRRVAPSARWEIPVTVRRGTDGLDFTGPYVRGVRTDRNIGLAWGDVPGDGTLRLFRGAKLRLAAVDPALIEEALRPGCRLIARVRLTDATGNPICARLRPPDIEWWTG